MREVYVVDPEFMHPLRGLWLFFWFSISLL
jgi:hypothetical protein